MILWLKRWWDGGVLVLIHGSNKGGRREMDVFMRFACGEEREGYNFLENEKMWSVGGLDGSDGFWGFQGKFYLYFFIKI